MKGRGSAIFHIDDVLEGLELKKKEFNSSKVCDTTTNILRIVHRMVSRHEHKFD